MVTLQTADNALKSFYLDAIAEALNMKTNPLLARIQRTSADIVGKDVKKAAKIAFNGGIGAGSETGDLPTAGNNQYAQLTATLKNLYGTIEISDKALRASANNEGAFVNLLNDEMETLVKSASFNFGRMLFGDGTGKVATVVSAAGKYLTLDNVNGVFEGMQVDVYTTSSSSEPVCSDVIFTVDRNNKRVGLKGLTDGTNTATIAGGSILCVKGSKGYEITGLDAIFSTASIYGQGRTNSFMTPYIQGDVGDITENVIQKAIDEIEESSGSKVNFIVCSAGVKRALSEYYKTFKTILPTAEFDGGFTATSFNGIPLVADRFCPAGRMYLLNTDDFKLHQLCDWQWLEGEDGKILKQVPGKPVYTATLVKYAELLCERPCGQGVLQDINEA